MVSVRLKLSPISLLASHAAEPSQPRPHKTELRTEQRHHSAAKYQMGDATPSKANDGTNAITQRARPLRHKQMDKNVTDQKTILTGIDRLSCGNALRKEFFSRWGLKVD